MQSVFLSVIGELLVCAGALAGCAAAQPCAAAEDETRSPESIFEMSHEDQLAFFQTRRQAQADDPHRPLYHMSPAVFDVKDAAGLCFWKGRYHLFYLNTPESDTNWHRSHAVSEDLVHWRDLPLLPKAIMGGTGQAWADEDRVILTTDRSLTTASDPMLVHWSEPQGQKFGDNCIWREGEDYYVVRRKLGPNTSAEILRSRDLAEWTSLGLFLDDGYYADPRSDCACPNVLPIGDGKHLLLHFAHNRAAMYYLGTVDMRQARFSIEEHGRMNYGPVFRGELQAPTSLVTPDGRAIAMWNVAEGKMQTAGPRGGRLGGVMSLPRRLSRNEQNTKGGFDRRELNPLCIEPIEELKALRLPPVTVASQAIPANGETVLPGVRGRAMELELVIESGQASEVGLRVLRSPGGEEQTTISLFMHAWGWPWKSDKRELMLDVSQSSIRSDVASRSPEIGPLFLEDGEPLRLRVFVDRSIIEVFANGRQCLTARAYPGRPDSTGVSVFARGGAARLVSMQAYPMKSIWPELKQEEGR